VKPGEQEEAIKFNSPCIEERRPLPSLLLLLADIGVTMHELLNREYPELQPAHLSLKNAEQLGISEAVAEQVPIMATPEESI